MATDLTGRRVLVVGASSGIGKSVAQHAVRAGADVVFAARRVEKLEAAVTDAGGGTVIAADVRNPDDCARVVRDAVAALGGLDLLVYATGVMTLVTMEDETFDGWRALFETNAAGAFAVMTAAIRELQPEGIISYIGSDAVGSPYPGLVPYAATKAALDEGVRGLRREYTDVRFSRIVVGPTTGTDVALDVDPERAGSMLPELLRHALIFERQMEAGELGELIVDLLGTALAHPGVEVEDVVLKAPGGPVPYGTDFGVAAEITAQFTEEEVTTA